MRRLALLAGLASLALAGHAAAAPAACATQGSPAARVISDDQVELRADILTNLGLWLGVITKKGFPQALRKTDSLCARGQVQVGADVYTLRGENADDWVARVLTPSRRKANIAYLIPAPDLALMMMLAGTNVPPTIRGYAMVVTDGDAHYVFQLYDAIPTDDVLLRDAALDLSGRAEAGMKWQDDKITIHVPKSDPNAAAAPAPAGAPAVTMESSPEQIAASLTGPDPRRAMTFFKGSYLTGACQASTSPDLARLRDMLRIDRLKLEPADELRRGLIGVTGLRGREAGARSPLKPDVCATALPQMIAELQATP